MPLVGEDPLGGRRCVSVCPSSPFSLFASPAYSYFGATKPAGGGLLEVRETRILEMLAAACRET